MDSLIIVTYEGSFGYFYVIDDTVYDRLCLLQDSLTNYLPIKGGITPEGYRWHKFKGLTQKPLKKGILDIKTVLEYRGMTEHLKMHFARKVAATKDHILNKLLNSLPIDL